MVGVGWTCVGLLVRSRNLSVNIRVTLFSKVVVSLNRCENIQETPVRRFRQQHQHSTNPQYALRLDHRIIMFTQRCIANQQKKNERNNRDPNETLVTMPRFTSTTRRRLRVGFRRVGGAAECRPTRKCTRRTWSTWSNVWLCIWIHGTMTTVTAKECAFEASGSHGADTQRKNGENEE